MDTVRFFAANTQPNPVEVDYWVDLYDNPYGGSIKYYNGTEWVRLAASGGIPDLSKYYTKVQVNQLLNDKASVQSVESKVDDEEVKDVIKNITFRTSNPNEVQMVLAKYDTTTVAISLPKASDVSAGIVTSDDFRDFVKQVDLQQLYQELYDSNSSIMNAINDIKAKYQKKLIAGSNIKISDDNVISAIISIEGGDIDVDGINSKIDELTGKLQEEVTRSTNAENKLASDIVTTVETEKDRAEGVEQVIINDLAEEVTRAKAAEQANKTAINKEVTDRQSAIATEVDNRNAAIEVEKQRALKAEAALDSKIATHTNEINTALATKADKSKLNKINDVNFAFNGVDYKVDSISLKGQALNINQGTFLNKTQEISQASTTQAGVMSSADKKKFDSVPNTVLSSISFRTGNASNLSIGAQTATYDTATGVYKSSERVIGMPVVSGTQAGIMIASDKTKLDGIAEGANAYTLPAATAQTLGGVKIGSNISLADGGVISINKTNVTTALGYTPLESVDTSNFVTLSGTQTIAGKKTFSDIIYFNQQIQGNALSASKLQTARQINGTDFNGSASITTSKWGISRNLTIGKTTKAVDGSNEVSWLTSEIADNATTTTDGWMSKEDKLALANLNSDFYGKEQVTVSVKKDGVAHSVQIDIKNKDNDEVIATSTGSSLTTRIVYGVKYYVSVPDIDKYTISAESLEYTASQQMRTINLEYTRYDEITIDQTVTDPNSMISGDVNGTVLQWIRNNTHRYVAKKTGDEQVTICQLSDNDTTKFYDNLTSSSAYIRSINHGVFVRIPRFWYKATETSTNIWKIGFSNRQQDSTWKEWDGNDLIGAYEGVVNGSQLLSISGEPSTGSVSQIDFKSYARTNGVGYTLVKWKHHCIVGVLYYALYGNTNCQATIGSGTNSYTKNTGLTNSLGMNDSSASATGNSGSINFLGLENWWGNKYEFIDNATFNHGGTDYKFYIVEDDGSSREVQAHQYTGTFYPTVMVFGEHLDLVMKPNTTSGTTSTGFCDRQYFSESSNQVVQRSCYYSHAYGGVACLAANCSASSTGTVIGSRLAFRGTIIEEKNIETFKAL